MSLYLPYQFQFSKLSGSNDWNISQLKHRNVSQLNSLFTYDNCGSTVVASVAQGYKCGKFIVFHIVQVSENLFLSVQSITFNKI